MDVVYLLLILAFCVAIQGLVVFCKFLEARK